MFQRQNGEEEWDGMKSLWFKHDVESGVSVVLETSSVHLFVAASAWNGFVWTETWKAV